ncbi:hypothetical protein CIPAW_14G005200 [Carya illinoinensis]|uniref:Uncharacterized protein n=1 Tax=Carya illinoinensis TaxID=32201 RepID=A0A8T1NET6_CARIL|nr:hypothetical protein CIPAW_14G005200 [Carya illinoinensis]
MAKDGQQEESGKHPSQTAESTPRSAKKGNTVSVDEDHQIKRSCVHECLFNLFCCFLCVSSPDVKPK